MGREVPKPDFMSQEQWDWTMSMRTHDKLKAGGEAQLADIRKNGWPKDLETLGGPTVLMTVKGRKSGGLRTTPVNYARVDNEIYVVGSVAGLDKHPAWALNLDTALEGEVEFRDEQWAFTAKKFEGAERETLWPILDAVFPLWGHFQKYSDRQFMVFKLTPVDQ